MIKYKIHLTVKGKTNIKKQLKTLIKIELILQMPKNHKINIKPYYFLGLTCAKAKGRREKYYFVLKMTVLYIL